MVVMPAAKRLKNSGKNVNREFRLRVITLSKLLVKLNFPLTSGPE